VKRGKTRELQEMGPGGHWIQGHIASLRGAKRKRSRAAMIRENEREKSRDAWYNFHHVLRSEDAARRKKG